MSSSLIRQWMRRWVTVEPIIILSMIGNTCTALVRPLYVKEFISEFYNYTVSGDDTECLDDQYRNEQLSNKIQAESSVWLLYLAAASGIPASLSTIFFGSTSDRFGRKLAMAIPLLAFAFQAAVYLFTVIFKLPLAVLFTGEVLQGLAGGYGLLYAATHAYLADATTEKQRTIRMVVADMLQYLGGGLNQLGQGYLIQFGYIPTLVVALGSNMVALYYLAIPPCLIETVEKSSTDHKGLMEVFQSMKELVVFNENGRRWQMFLLILYVLFCVGEFIGVTAIYVLYGTDHPFYWGCQTAGIALALIWIFYSIGMLVGTKLFSLCLGDYWLMQISCLSFMASYLIMGLADTTAELFIGTVVGCLQLMSLSVARSVLSKIARPEETGAMFSLIACMQSCSFIFCLVSTSLYAATVSFLPPLTFFVYSGATLIPAGITVILQVFWPMKRKEPAPINNA
ncbi:proton-coupled folate transporter-like isoform X2 [Patiria miniata]|uniref:Proton-coupled folate transporter n=1 Tax=Patiria miniata TaxID=46514 RepID=A0A913Z1R2_PATMI|nr:proton-coupled folate transporter-like isoform X2 [Patiria miniata]